MHLFVDESQRGGYLLAAAVLSPAQLHRTRTMLRGLLLPGERRVHFNKETDSRRKLVISRLAAAEIKAWVYTGKGNNELVRCALLGRIVTDALPIQATRLVLDSRDAAGNARDRSVIAGALAGEHSLTYEHMPSSTEPCTWVADAVAWAWGAGGDWRRRIELMVDRVTDIGPLSR
ncbi:hypothetical protein [Amycolatopsis sp. GM8]|uniref:hypothetical protein n=1 Tax=Amycolatopsis sp. GM8 TaxID=2896530 RepID=UPI001F29F510|nr:hypothetical protein [Amycolatopsis sp. GM8]